MDESAITVPAVARVGAGVPPAHVQRALDVLVARHAALRTVFGRSEEGVLVQHVRPAGALPLTVTEHRTRPRDLPARVLQAGADEPFRLPRGPVAHAQLHRAGAAGGLVVVWLHRVISDLVSVQVLSLELAPAAAWLPAGPARPADGRGGRHGAGRAADRPAARLLGRRAGVRRRLARAAGACPHPTSAGFARRRPRSRPT